MGSKSNNDKLMQKTGLMIVYAWVLLAVGFFVLTAWRQTFSILTGSFPILARIEIIEEFLFSDLSFDPLSM